MLTAERVAVGRDFLMKLEDVRSMAAQLRSRIIDPRQANALGQINLLLLKLADELRTGFEKQKSQPQPAKTPEPVRVELPRPPVTVPADLGLVPESSPPKRMPKLPREPF